MRIGKLLLVFSALAMVATLAACGGSEEGQAPPEEQVAPSAPAEQQGQDDGPADKTLTVTVPSMDRVNESPMPDTFGEDEDSLRDYAGIHLVGTGFPWQDEANVYLAGHRLGYPGTPSFLAFYDIDDVQMGEEITVTDANGEEYTYEVYEFLTVAPTDLYVIDPIEGRNILTLQTCTLPDYSQRVIIRAELQES
ncbi:MAG: sortase [Actinomycetota bacterium]|nr:sortase [Actinomycetota bacterium]